MPECTGDDLHRGGRSGRAGLSLRGDVQLHRDADLAGNCPGGSVIWVGATSWSPSTSGTAADGGDDIVYLRVGYNESVNIVGNARCRTWWGLTYNGPAVSVWIYPTRANQTWYIGPNGVSHN